MCGPRETLVGAELLGGDKWMGGVLAADGNIYGMPHNATQVLRFDPRTQQSIRHPRWSRTLPQ